MPRCIYFPQACEHTHDGECGLEEIEPELACPADLDKLIAKLEDEWYPTQEAAS